MRSLLDFALILLTTALPAAAGDVAISVEAAPFEAAEADILAVLRSASDALSARFPDRAAMEVRVTRSQTAPITLFARGPGGRYEVRLATGKLYWSQYAYQFGHELMHIYCNYREGDDSTDWFEETLCETSSLFVLRRMAEAWEKKPPFPNWKDYSASLRDYAARRIEEHALPRQGRKTLAAFYALHAADLPRGRHDEPQRRAVYSTMATALLPLFEEKPEQWAAVEFLNRAKPERGLSFARHLDNWEQQCPEKHRALVRAIRREFGL